jgi:hypothetical protein
MNTSDRGIDVAMAHLTFTMGNIAAAQDVSFNLLYSLQGLCPAMLKMNARIELMRGSYEVADKYLSLLERRPTIVAGPVRIAVSCTMTQQ